MKDTFVEAFKNLTFNRNGKESAIFEIKYYKLPGVIFQHLVVKELVNKKR